MFKKIFFVVLALVATLSLFIVSASADYVDGQFSAPDGTIGNPNLTLNGSSVNLDGYYAVIIDVSDITLQNASGITYPASLYGTLTGTNYVQFGDRFGELGTGVANSTMYGNKIFFSVVSQDDITIELDNNPTGTLILYLEQYPFDLGLRGSDVWPYIPFDVKTVDYDVEDSADDVMSVWSLIMTWIVTALASVQAVFYVNGSLTFVGTLATVGVSIGIALLIVGIVQRFLKLRG